MKNGNGWEGKKIHDRHARQLGARQLILTLRSKLGYFCYWRLFRVRKFFSLPAIAIFHHPEDVCQVPITVRARGPDRAGFGNRLFLQWSGVGP